MTTKQSKELAEALSIMSAKSSVLKERDELRALMWRTFKLKSSLQMISADAQGCISVQDLEKALAVIKHKPDDEVGQAVIQKLDVNNIGFVEIEHVLGLVCEEGLGIEVDDEALRHDDRQCNGTATMPMATTMMRSHGYHHLASDNNDNDVVARPPSNLAWPPPSQRHCDVDIDTVAQPPPPHWQRPNNKEDAVVRPPPPH
ncbi:hypothetical protein EV363DRAFT_1541296 [Boletus edulis]|nr:hypothetical protein EV363DRAFT_1541296 [Boletus edulis]